MVLQLGLLLVTALAVAGQVIALWRMAGTQARMTQILADMAYRTQTNQFVFHKGERAPDSWELYPARKDEAPKTQTQPDDLGDFDTPKDVGPEIT